MSRGVQDIPQKIKRGIEGTKVLLVGAGGIGCEVIKNLVLMGFPEIEVVDLDTIDYSNLNRQFLFHKVHVKQPKALVAAKAAQAFNPEVKITPYHANIMDDKFDLDWFKSFDVVFNALDNLEARRYVNKMCLAADIPLIESGTAGYLGQSTVIKKGITECFDCVPKETPKTFPVCTIRLTPSLPIHCIVWAKNYLFNKLFGEEEEDLDKEKDESNGTAIEELKKESEALAKIKGAMTDENFINLVFDKVFKQDILKALSFEETWKDKTKPVPLNYEDLNKHVDSVRIESNGSLFENKKLSLEENFKMFKESGKALAERYLNLKKVSSNFAMSFDKDDQEMLNFVTATSNFRAHIFSIEQKSIFEVKAMAGNIIPAIATTNAIIAGIMVMHSFKILNNQLEQCKTTFLVSGSNRAQLFLTECLAPPKPDCAICSIETFTVDFDISKKTIGQFILDIKSCLESLKKLDDSDALNKLDLEDIKDMIFIIEGSRGIYDAEYDGEDEDKQNSTLSTLGVKYKSYLSIDFDYDELNPIQLYLSEPKRQNRRNKLDLDVNRLSSIIKHTTEKRVSSPVPSPPHKRLHSSQNNMIEDSDDDLIIL